MCCRVLQSVAVQSVAVCCTSDVMSCQVITHDNVAEQAHRCDRVMCDRVVDTHFFFFMSNIRYTKKICVSTNIFSTLLVVDTHILLVYPIFDMSLAKTCGFFSFVYMQGSFAGILGSFLKIYRH